MKIGLTRPCFSNVHIINTLHYCLVLTSFMSHFKLQNFIGKISDFNDRYWLEK